MVMILLGVVLMGSLKMVNPEAVTMEDISVITISHAVLLAAIPFGLLFLIMPFIAMLIKRTIPVTGMLYCLSVGYHILDDQGKRERKNEAVTVV